MLVFIWGEKLEYIIDNITISANVITAFVENLLLTQDVHKCTFPNKHVKLKIRIYVERRV